MSRHRRDSAGRWMESENSSIRKQFHRDYDRLVFSDAFRRLGSKTQVHPLADNDQVRNRLSHSLEVSCVGRTFGMRIGEWLAGEHELPTGVHPDDLGTVVQAAALAHDIGNPPFGHSGEDAIRDFFKSERGEIRLTPLHPHQRAELQSFEGNAQGLRVLTQLDPNRFAGGMRLSAATLGAFVKYPWARSAASTGKYGVNESEWNQFSELAELLGLVSLGANKVARHPLVYLVEAADDACYSVIDIEDAVEMGVLEFDQAFDLIAPLLDRPLPPPSGDRQHQWLYQARGRLIDQLELQMERRFQDSYGDIMSGRGVPDLLADSAVVHLKRFAQTHVYQAEQKQLLQSNAKAALFEVLDALTLALYERYLAGRQRHGYSRRARVTLEMLNRSLPPEDQPLYHQYQQALDFVSGMTDNFLIKFAERLQQRF